MGETSLKGIAGYCKNYENCENCERKIVKFVVPQKMGETTSLKGIAGYCENYENCENCENYKN